MPNDADLIAHAPTDLALALEVVKAIDEMRLFFGACLASGNGDMTITEVVGLPGWKRLVLWTDAFEAAP